MKCALCAPPFSILVVEHYIVVSSTLDNFPPSFIMIWIFIFASSFAIAEVATCPDKETSNFLMEHTEKTAVTKFLADKVFVDVSRSEEFVKVTRCSMSKFKQADGKLLVVIHNIDTNGKISIFRDMWKEEEGSGVFNINGKAEETPYDEKLYILHADENAVAYYACNPATYNTRRLFRVAISLDKTKMGTPQAQKSVDTAFSKLKEMEAVIGALTNMPTKDCPAEFPEVPVPAELTELTKQP